MPVHTTLGDFILGLQGLAVMRSWWTDPATVKARVRSLIEVTRHLEEEPWSGLFHCDERTVTAGYAEWAALYDGPGNPIFTAEEPVVRKILAGYPAGRALDAACGTGRHASYLASLGHEVIGVDCTPEMLAIARDKTPEARFEIGDLTALPLPDGDVDLAVCALSLTHCVDLEPSIRELARVVRPGGHVTISDVHPFPVHLGAHASYRRELGTGGYIQNHVHLHSDYLAAFRAAGLEVIQCLEPLYGDAEVATLEGFGQHVPGLLDAAVKGLPIVIVWELKKPAP